MLGKTKTGSGFKGVLYYCLQEKKEPEILYSNNVIGNDAKELIKEFEAVREENINISKPVWHTSLSFAENDNITNEKMGEIAQRFMEKAGFSAENNQYVVIKHNDKDHSHCHIVANRVGFDGKAVSDYYYKSQTVKWAKELEKEYNLIKVQEIALAKKLEQTQTLNHDKKFIKEHVERAIGDKNVTSLDDLSKALKKDGVELEVLKHSKTGKEYGVNFRVNGNTYKGSDIAKRLAYKSLSQLLPSPIRIATKIISKGISHEL